MFSQSVSAVATPRRLAAIAAAAAMAIVAGCTMAPDYYPRKSDAKPHPGVAKALTMPVHGIDVSRWQAQIDWAQVKDAGTKFVFMKATEGGDHADPNFRANWAGAKAAGIPVGAYHFVYWCRPAIEQAHWFVQHIPNDPDALPPVLDVEWNGHSATCPRKVSREVALEKMRVMLTELERHTGKRPIIYTDITFHKDVLEGGEFDEYPFWLRSVAAEPEERYVNRKWTFWQWTTTGRVPGIRGDVDRNVFNGSEKEWEAWLKRARVLRSKPEEIDATSSILPRGLLPF